MEGWLFLIRSNRFGLQYSRKRYFALKGNFLHCYKNIPKSNRGDPLKMAFIDSYIRVADNGRESFHRNVFYIFTLYNSSNHNDQLKLGARSSEEAAKWIQSLKQAAMEESPNIGEKHVQCPKTTSQSFRLAQARGRNRLHSIDWTVFSTGNTKRMAFDVIAPSPWTIFDCKNGLRLFKEAKDGHFLGMQWDDHPAIMAVGVVDAPSETIFQTLMSFGPSRSEWDFCLAKGSVVEHLDGHTDIIHKKLSAEWLPWGMKRRDLLLRRYWRREDDGTYVIVYHSIHHHPNCQPKRGYIRISLKSGGYVISPVNQGKHSVVKHMLAIDWRFWKPYSLTSSSKDITIRMLARVAALREFVKAKHGNCSCSSFSQSEETTREISLLPHENEDIKEEVKMDSDDIKRDDSEEDLQELASVHAGNMGVGSFVQLNDATDEFFDVPGESDCDESEVVWPSKDVEFQDQRHPMLSTAAVFVKKLQDLSAHGRGYMRDASMNNAELYSYGSTLSGDPSCTTNCSWATADPSAFLIRGESYLKDHQKIKASSTLMKMVGADWLKSEKREDNLAGREGGIVERYANQGSSDFFFIINIQVPGTTAYNLAFYYTLDTELAKIPQLESFVKGDNAYRNSRFKLIPYISKGSWIVKQSVGKKACLLGQALEINYFSGRNYVELDIDIGSSTVARGVASLVLSYLNNLVIEMAFVIQGNTQEELPEFVLGTCRLNYLDAAKAIHVDLC